MKSVPEQPYPKSAEDQVREIRKLLTDATERLDQAVYALSTLRARLDAEQAKGGERST